MRLRVGLMEGRAVLTGGSESEQVRKDITDRGLWR